MKRYYYAIGILTFVTFSFSCSRDWLNIKPNISAAIPATLKDCQSLLDNTTQMNSNCPGLGETASDGHFIVESALINMIPTIRNAYTWINEQPYTNVSDWSPSAGSGSYVRIFTCNLVLETLNNIEVDISNLEEYNNIKGQALFIRSKTFYELAQLFAPAFSPVEDNASLGIPLRLESDINIPSVRSTVESTYGQIIKDLVEAAKLLPITPVFKTRASKPAATGLLARCLLSMEQYEKAGLYADSTLKNYPSILDYNNLNASAAFPVLLFNNEVIFHSTMINYADNTVNLRIDTALKALYNANDLRSKVYFASSNGQFTFKGHYNGQRLCFNGLAADEILLIRAECYARSSKVGEAMADLNKLLINRWSKSVTYVPITATDAEDALRKVLLERRKELLLRGLRWSDLRRLNRDPRFAITLERKVAGKTYTLTPNSYRYTFPIPDDIIQMTGMPQNPGWAK